MMRGCSDTDKTLETWKCNHLFAESMTWPRLKGPFVFEKSAAKSSKNAVQANFVTLPDVALSHGQPPHPLLHQRQGGVCLIRLSRICTTINESNSHWGTLCMKINESDSASELCASNDAPLQRVSLHKLLVVLWGGGLSKTFWGPWSVCFWWKCHTGETTTEITMFCDCLYFNWKFFLISLALV